MLLLLASSLGFAWSIAAAAAGDAAATAAGTSSSTSALGGVPTYKALPGFPEQLFASYYIPASPTNEPQPIVQDPVLKITYPLNLTDPKTVPTSNDDPRYYPSPTESLSSASATAAVQSALAEIQQIISGGEGSSCSQCQDALAVGQKLALRAPTLVPAAMVSLCQTTGFASNSSCESSYGEQGLGPQWTQVLALADFAGQDGQYICYSLSSDFCKEPKVNALDTSRLFPRPRSKHARAPRPSGKRVKVLHLSDMHLDPRFDVGAESNCTASLCCRSNAPGAGANGSVTVPASLYGDFRCDSPYDLITAALQSVGPLAGLKEGEAFGWSVYTGDLVAHDPNPQLSKAYIEYVETSLYGMIAAYVKGPVFAALGNHDTSPVAIDPPQSLPGNLSQQLSWNYNHVAGLWLNDGWISAQAAAEARTHYGVYSIVNHYGLRIVSLNMDFFYKANVLNFIDTANPDVSGMLSFLIDELQAAEDAGERVWIVGHVLTGWDGTNPLPNPTNLFQAIIERYSPHVVANVLFGHTHEDINYIFYANNGTEQTADNAIVNAWIGPSVTPLTNLNSGFRVYEVDTGNFEIYDAYTFYSDVEGYGALDPATQGPTFEFEYSTRDIYGPAANWPASAPLNATFWHQVSEAMESNSTLVEIYNGFQGKSSPRTPDCSSAACQAAKICYMRSATQALGKACPKGFGSVQSPYTGKS